MDNLFLVAFLASDDHDLELIHDGVHSDAKDARARAYEAQRCRPDDRVGIFRLTETVAVEFTTVLVATQ